MEVARLAPTLNATIHTVVAWEYPILLGADGGMPGSWKPDETAKEILNKSLDDAFGSQRLAGLRTSVSQGHPTFVLLDANMDTEHAKCPVLVVHRDAN